MWISSPKVKDFTDSLSARVVGRYAGQPVTHPVTGEILVDRNEEITEEVMAVIMPAIEEWLQPLRDRLQSERRSRDDIERLVNEERIKYQINVRSPLMCDSEYGVCQQCYGRALHNLRPVDIGEVASVAEESSASAEQVSASTQQTSASTQEIAASAQELARTAERLQELVGRFTLV